MLIPDFIAIAAAVLLFVGIWGVIIFLLGWKESREQAQSQAELFRRALRRFSIVLFGACCLGLAAAVIVHSTIPKNPAVRQAVQVAVNSAAVRQLLGDPVQYLGGMESGGYRGFGDGARLRAALRLNGSSRSGTLLVCGLKREGRWQLVFAEVVTLDQRKIMLVGHEQDCE